MTIFNFGSLTSWIEHITGGKMRSKISIPLFGFQQQLLLDEEKKIIYIAGAPHLREALQEKFSSLPETKYFYYEQDPMYTKRESELIQQFLQQHGHLPRGNEEVEDLF